MNVERMAAHPRERGVATAAVWGLFWFAALIGCATIHPARAESAGASDVLTGQNVTEEKLLEVLTPESGVQKRSLRVKATGSRLSVPGPTRPSASLLITFQTSSSDLTTNAKQQLDVVGAALKNVRLASYKFTVEGHADPRGDRASNLVLSQNRAGSVRSYLIDSHGIDPARLVAEGRGDREVLNHTFPAAPENRRVTIVTNIE
jgi:OmpA-OmpF porin, OOP family